MQFSGFGVFCRVFGGYNGENRMLNCTPVQPRRKRGPTLRFFCFLEIHHDHHRPARPAARPCRFRPHQRPRRCHGGPPRREVPRAARRGRGRGRRLRGHPGRVPGAGGHRRAGADRRRADRLHQFLRRGRGQSLRRHRRARAVGGHAEGRGAARHWRLRHARLRPRAGSGARRDGEAAGDGQRDDAEPGAVAPGARAAQGNRPQPRRRLSLPEVPVPELGFGVGDAGRPHRRRQRQDPHRCRRRACRPHDQAPGGEGRLPRPHRAPGDLFRFLAQGLRAAPGQLPQRNQPDHGRALQRRAAAPGVRRRRRQRLVHRGDVPGAGDGRRRPRSRRAAGLLRRRARADQGARHPAAGGLHPGRPACPWRAVDRRLSGLRADWKRRTWRPTPRRSTAASTRCRCSP